MHYLTSYLFTFMKKKIIRAPTIETSIFGYLNGSYTYTSLIYNFLIVVSNKHSIPSTQISHKVLKWSPLINYQELYIITFQFFNIKRVRVQFKAGGSYKILKKILSNEDT